jgi:hypothetical protein
MSIINQSQIDNLCRDYSIADRDYKIACSLKIKINEQLTAEFAKLQTMFRRKLSRAVKFPPSTVHYPRVYASIAHGKTPVTVTPIASATICVRKGVEIHLSFVATADTIEFETSKLKAAIEAFI